MEVSNSGEWVGAGDASVAAPGTGLSRHPVQRHPFLLGRGDLLEVSNVHGRVEEEGAAAAGSSSARPGLPRAPGAQDVLASMRPYCVQAAASTEWDARGALADAAAEAGRSGRPFGVGAAAGGSLAIA